MTKKKTKRSKSAKYEEKVKFKGTFDELINLSLNTKMPTKPTKK
jgi:hypothetical protein